MKAIMTSITKHPFVCIAILVVLTAIFMIPLPGLIVDPSSEGMMIPDDPDKDYYDEVKEIYGDDLLLTVSIASDDIFKEDILQSIENLSDKINDITLNINGKDTEVVTRVISLTTVTNITDREGDLDTGKLIEYIPSEIDELERIKKDALRNETFLNDIVSKDGKVAAINAYLLASPSGYITYNHEITSKVQEFIDIETERLKKLGINSKIFEIGFPYIKVKITEYIEKDMRKLVPICLLITLTIFWLTFRSFTAVVTPIATGILSVTWTLGFMAFVGYPINAITSAIPILLIVIGCSEDVHMISEYRHQLRAGNDKLTAIKKMATKTGLAIFLTSFTTIAGFLALTINKIPMIKEFGIITAVGLACNFAITILFVPTYFRFAKAPKRFTAKLEKKHSSIFKSIEEFLCHVAMNKRALVIIATTIIVILGVVGTIKVKTDSDYISFFKEDSEIRERMNNLHSNISGAKSILIVIDTGQEDGVKNPKIMAGIAKFQDYLNQRFDKTISVADYIKIMHREMNGGDMEFFKIPESEELISQYLLMIEGDDLERVLESTYSQACIVVRHNYVGSWQVNKKLEAIRGMGKQLFPKHVQVRITGIDILDNKASDYMSQGQALGLGIAVVLIFLIISILFISPKVGLLAMIPNVIPILTNFGIMGWFNIPLNPGTSIVAVIVLGIAINDTIHLLVSFQEELKSTNDQNEAMRNTIKRELLPVMSTSFALALGFCIMISSNFVSNIYFGCLVALAMLIAFASDLFVTPALLLTTQLVSSWDMLKLKINKEITEASLLLHGLRVSEVKKIALLGVIAGYKENEFIIKKGDLDREMYLILDGNVDVVIQKEKKLVKTLQKGDIFGEMAFITGGERTADVIAKGPVELLKIDDRSLNNVKSKYPKIGAKIFYNMSRILSKRLKETTKDLAKKL